MGGMHEALPSRPEFYACRWQWMAEKGEQDRAAFGEGDSEEAKALWLYDGKLYDLAAYMDRHPGGRDWLAMTRGMDVTPLVESHHLNEALVKDVLKKYYVREARSPKRAPQDADFSFEEGGFHKVMKRRALAHLGPTMAARGPTLAMRAATWFLLVSWAGCLLWASLRDEWLPVILGGFLLHALIGVGHDGMHTADSWWRYLMDLSMFAHVEWRVSHVISHHHFPNSEVDFEVAAIEPFIYSLARAADHKHPYLPMYLWAILLILGPFELVGRIINVCVKRVQPPRPEHLLVFLELALLVWGHGRWRPGFRRWLAMHAVASALMGLEAMPLHHPQVCWSSGK